MDGHDLTALRTFLERRGVAVVGELIAERLPGGRSNVTYKISDEQSTWVVRHPPLAGATPSAHDMVREFTVTQALQNSAVPVARTVALDSEGMVLGVPLSIVEFVEGRVFRRSADLDALDPRDAESLSESLLRILASLHNVDYRAVGLGEFGRPDGYLIRQINRWAGQWGRVKTDDHTEITDIVAALQERVPTEVDTTLVHGDFRVDNTIVAGNSSNSVLAVVDWELSTLGDPLSDVALMCAYRARAFDLVQGYPTAWASPRWPSADALAQKYSICSGRELRNWDFYLGLANFKIGVIAAGIAYRGRLNAADPAATGTTAALAAPEFFAAAREALRSK
ncbi:phosphotransferase family protein [Mycobacterium sp. SM1]|uniref:phosphotransferase family protein n=1 Tax=Mycobacterium sp. SM1 TaxID=2816243 RepID=UPI001BD19B7E|nr:phosphotransferase family protein [Mycobacterium sp. SM1]MBS4730331.1 phosphotransferase family protein [Mycobacterium sp. SM1]